eukprot:jgi/Ulvmu1/11168/UM072_0004.1
MSVAKMSALRQISTQQWRLCVHQSCRPWRTIPLDRLASSTQCKAARPAAEPDFDVQLLDPVPISDKNFEAKDFDDAVEIVDESTTRREGFLSYFYGDELDHEILIKRGPEGELDLRDITLLNHEDDTHAPPSYTGIIPQTPAQYQAIPVETVISADILDNLPEKKLLRQLLLIKVAAEEPEHELDFDNAFCFDCRRQEFYKVAYVSVREPSDISDPVLRFQPEHDMFILDSRETMPTPMMVNLKHEANEIGADFDVDLFSGLPPPATALALPAGDSDEEDYGESSDDDGGGARQVPAAGAKAAEVSAAEVVQALVAPTEGGETVYEAAAAAEAAAGEEVDGLTGGVEPGSDDTPDVPAVDLA